MLSSIRGVDDQLFLWFNQVAIDSAPLHGAAVSYAKYAVVLFGVLLVLVLVWARHRSSRVLAVAVWTPVATLLAVALNQPLGHAVHEVRPYVRFPSALRLASVTSDFSFPSDHSVMVGAVTAGMFLVSWRAGVLSAAIGILLGVARVYIAAHYPWDIVAGFAFGAVVCLVGWWLLHRPLIAATSWGRSRTWLAGWFSFDSGMQRQVHDRDVVAL